MKSKLIIAANLITLVIVAYVGFKVKAQKHDPRRAGITARGALTKAQGLESAWRFQEASVWYNQAFRIGTTGIRSVADQGRHRADALAIISHHDVPSSLAIGIKRLALRLASEAAPNPTVGALLRIVEDSIQARHTRALEAALQPLKDKSQRFWRLWLLAGVHLDSGNPKEALTVLKTLRTEHPKFSGLSYRRGLALLAIGHSTDAVDAFGRAEDADFGPAALLGAAQSYATLGEWTSAEGKLAQALKQKPESARRLKAIGYTLRKHKRYLSAANALLGAYHINKADEVLVHAVQCLLSAGLPKRALAASEERSSGKAVPPTLVFLRAKAFISIKDDASAGDQLRRFLSTSKDTHPQIGTAKALLDTLKPTTGIPKSEEPL